jgi:hypothetical protein
MNPSVSVLAYVSRWNEEAAAGQYAQLRKEKNHEAREEIKRCAQRYTRNAIGINNRIRAMESGV